LLSHAVSEVSITYRQLGGTYGGIFNYRRSMALATTRRWGPTTSLESLFHWGATGAGHAGELGSLQRSDCVQFPVGRVVAMAVHAVWLVGVHAPVVRVDPPVAESAWAEEAGFHVAWGVQVAACMARLADACFLVVCGVQVAACVFLKLCLEVFLGSVLSLISFDESPDFHFTWKPH
jgi:hypothetical protein